MAPGEPSPVVEKLGTPADPRTIAPFVRRGILWADAANDTTSPGLAEALRRTRLEIEKLLVANRVPPLEGYELLLAALRRLPADLEDAHLDRLLVHEVRRGLSGWREQARLWKEQAATWVDLLVQAGLIPKADRATWLRTIGAHQR
jgi:hypothetical protein